MSFRWGCLYPLSIIFILVTELILIKIVPLIVIDCSPTYIEDLVHWLLLPWRRHIHPGIFFVAISVVRRAIGIVEFKVGDFSTGALYCFWRERVESICFVVFKFLYTTFVIFCFTAFEDSSFYFYNYSKTSSGVLILNFLLGLSLPEFLLGFLSLLKLGRDFECPLSVFF